MSGVYTPDSLSREGSPTPEDEIIQQQSNQQLTMVTNVAQRQPVLPPSAAELRISQPTQGYPVNTVIPGMKTFETIFYLGTFYETVFVAIG